MINAKSTKAQLLEYIGELQADLDTADRKLQAAQPVSIQDRFNAFRFEAVAMVRDVYRLGLFCRKGFDQVVDEFKTLCYNKG